MVTEARDRHSVLQVAAPLELDVQDPVHLKDTQACQVRQTPTSLVYRIPESAYRYGYKAALCR